MAMRNEASRLFASVAILAATVSTASYAEAERVWLNDSATAQEIYKAFFGDEVSSAGPSRMVIRPTRVQDVTGGAADSKEYADKEIRRIASLPVDFAYNSTTLTEKSKAFLNELVGAYQAKKRVMADAKDGGGKLMVYLGGHTDSKGSAAYNETLSLLRATAVKDYLVDKSVEPSAIRATGYGEDRPLDADNPTSEKNRRVEIRFEVVATNR